MSAAASPHDRIDALKRRLTGFDRLGDGGDFASFDITKQYCDMARGAWRIGQADLPMTVLSKGNLDVIQHAIARQLRRAVQGDFIEAGVWRGGAVALMLALLREHGEKERRVLAADSFAGIPHSLVFRFDPVDDWPDRWVAPLEDFRLNLDSLGLLDEALEVLPGFFADTLPGLAERTFALVRLDADSLESTLTALAWLYPLLSKDGVIIIDDWHLPGCRAAVSAYIARHRLQATVRESHDNGYWFKREEWLEPPLPQLPVVIEPPGAPTA